MAENRIRFGPSGNSESFYNEGHKETLEAPRWLKNMGLSAFEYPFGRGISLSDETADKIRQEAETYDIVFSAHAPYFINLANPDPEKRENSFGYILSAADRVKRLGGNRIVVHVGAQMKMDRQEAMAHCRDGLKEALTRLDDAGLSDVHICTETMGKYSQIGDLDEIMDFCQLSDKLIPCLDFAHLHALKQGQIKTQEDMKKLLDRGEELIGIDRMRTMHVHFSTIEFGPMGEKRHRTFADKDFGPRFETLAPLLAERGYTPVIICESKGTMAEDAKAMSDIYQNLI